MSAQSDCRPARRVQRTVNFVGAEGLPLRLVKGPCSTAMVEFSMMPSSS